MHAFTVFTARSIRSFFRGVNVISDVQMVGIAVAWVWLLMLKERNSEVDEGGIFQSKSKENRIFNIK